MNKSLGSTLDNILFETFIAKIMRDALAAQKYAIFLIDFPQFFNIIYSKQVHRKLFASGHFNIFEIRKFLHNT